MSEEEESNEKSNNEDEEKEDDENEEGEGEGEENEDEEKEEGDEGEEKEDEEGEEKEDEEGEEKEDDEEEDEEENTKKKKKKNKTKDKKEKKEEEKTENGTEGTQIKFPETKLAPTKEIKMDLNLNTSENNNNIFFNGNDITMANIIPKKTTLQLLMEISSEMDALTSHLEKVLPSPTKYNVDYNIINPAPTIPIIQNYSLPPVPNYDQEDLEIKKLINKANEMTNNSILNNKNENKIYEDKACQSDDEIEIENSYNKSDETRTRQEYYNENMRNGSRFPYDPYKHLDYYNDLRNNNNGNNDNKTPFSDNNRIKRMDDIYKGNNNNFRRHPIIYSQPESNNNYNSMRNTNFHNENNNRETDFQRYKPGSITQAMDILLDKK